MIGSLGCSLMPPGDCRLKGVLMVSSRKHRYLKLCKPEQKKKKKHLHSWISYRLWSYKTRWFIHYLVNIQDWVFIQASGFSFFGWTMKTFTKTKLQNKACQCNAQFPCQNWGLWLNAHCFKAFFQLAYGLKLQIIKWFLSVYIPKSICNGRKNHNSKHAIIKKRAFNKTFSTLTSRYKQKCTDKRSFI